MRLERRLLALSLFSVLLIGGRAEAQSCADPSQPSVGLSISAPNSSGIATATVTYSFPSWVTARALSIWKDGAQVAATNPSGASGQWIVNVSVTCARGPLAYFSAYATSCNRWSTPGYVASAAQTVPVSSKPSLSMAISGGGTTGAATVTLTYDFPNTASASQRPLALWIDGVQHSYWESNTQSGTWTIAVNTNCWATGSHDFTGFATACKVWNDPDFMTSQTQAVTVDTKPTLSLAVSDPNASGTATATLTYSFPNTSTATHRPLSLWIDGAQYAYTEVAAQSGTWVVPVSTACWKAGSHSFVGYATACKKWNDPLFVTSASTTVVVQPPDVGLQTVGPDAGIMTVNVPYTFPNTTSYTQRNLTLWRDGVQIADTRPTQQSGSWAVPMTTACWAEGSHTFSAYATVCEKWNQEGFSDNETGVVAITSKPTIALTDLGESVGGGRRIRVDYSFANTNSVTQRQIAIYQRGRLIETTSPAEATGFFERTLNGCGDVRAVATSCGMDDAQHRADSNVVALPVEGCKESKGVCVNTPPSTFSAPGKPVNLGTGDVSLSIPLFSIAHATNPLRFELHYHSNLPVYPAIALEIAHGWTFSFVDQLVPIDPSGSRLYHLTAEGQETFYQRIGSTNVWSAFRPVESEGRVVLEGSEYHLIDKSGTTTAFSATTGQWLSRTDRWGNVVFAEFSAGGDLSAIVDADGRRVVVTSSGGRITQLQLPDGETWRFEYSNDTLAAIHDAMHTGTTPWRTFTYQADSLGSPRNLVAMRDEEGKLIEGHEYDAADRGITSYAEAMCDSVTLEYDTPVAGTTRVKHIIDGTVEQVAEFTLLYQAGRFVPTTITGGCSSCGSNAVDGTRYYDMNGRLVQVIDGAGTASVFGYDGHGNVTTRTEAFGTPLERTTTLQYGMTTWPSELTETRSQGPLGLAGTRRAWNGDETVLTIVAFGYEPGSATETEWTTTQTYDARHRLIAVVNPRNATTQYAYYPDDDLDPLRRGRLASVQNPAGHVTTYGDYDIYGTARRIVDANGVVTRLETDALGRVVRRISEAVTGDPNEAVDFVTTSVYDGRDRLIETSSAFGRVTRFGYEDGTDRLIDTIVVNGPGNEVERRHVRPDVIGNRAEEQLQSCDTPAPRCLSWTTRWSERKVFDTQNRLASVQRSTPAGATVAYTYDSVGRLAAVKDENHASANTIHAYDVLGRLERVTQSLAGAIGGTITTEYGYDVHDDLTSVTDPNGNVTTYTYDDFGRMRSQSSPVTGTTTYTYDAAGNLLSTTNALGTTTTRSYDLLNRPLESTATSGGTSETVQWTYDVGAYGKGRLSTMSDPAGVTAYTYDRRGLLRSETRVMDGQTLVQEYGYDADGNRTRVRYPSGREVAYVMDWSGRPVSATGTWNGTSVSYVTTAHYLPFGPMTEMTVGNGTTQTRTFDSRYQPLTNRLATPGGVIAEYAYSADGAGNITAIADMLDAGYSRTFGYDDLNRLTVANSGPALWGNGSYAYDAMGNLTSALLGTSQRTFTFAGTTPKINTAVIDGVTVAVTYDAAGNETDGGRTYSPRNLLRANGAIEFAFDGRGVRVARSQSGTTSHYAYLPELNLLSTSTADIIWLGDLPIAQETSTGTRYTFSDHLGTPLLQTDSSGTVVWRAEYEPYGAIHSMRTGNATDQPLRFPGQDVADGTGEAYNVFRWYRAEWGRYTQADPITYQPASFPFAEVGLDDLARAWDSDFEAESTEAFGYTQSNPVRATDPVGLLTQKQSLCVATYAGAGALGGAIAGGGAGLVTTAGVLSAPGAVGGAMIGGLGGAIAGTILCTEIRTRIGECITEFARTRSWTCRARCSLYTVPGDMGSGYIEGHGSGSNQNDACKAAKKNASSSAPAGYRTKHCQCYCSNQ